MAGRSKPKRKSKKAAAASGGSRTTVWLLGDQLTPRASALQGLSKKECVVLLIESIERARQIPYHRQKLVLIWSAMRHFAIELRALGYTVDYREQMPDFESGLRAHLKEYRPAAVRLMENAEHGVTARLGALAEKLGVRAEIAPNNLFLSDAEEFAWPVTRRDAEKFLENFLEDRLDLFGPYEDAIVAGERALYHSLLSPLINIGLLDPLDVCRRAEKRYREGKARLNSVEGFIRQIIGWREFVYQVYRLEMPDYAKRNHLVAKPPLPGFYWTGDTGMRCCADAIGTLKRWGINHHIQRLMVTGNFALIAGIDPQAVNEWYWFAYIDAFEWVVTPNVLGLSLFADAGRVATKPYAASANYINRMSDCCAGCEYDPRQATGDKGCPFNSLYWDFLARNRGKFRRNARMKLVLALLARRPAAAMRKIRRRAADLRRKLRRGERI